MSQTDFQKVIDFNTQFGVKLHYSPQFDIFTNEPSNVEFCLKLIREEIKELQWAIKTDDYIEFVDALADILYVTYGMSGRIGCNMDYMLDNFIKHDKTFDDMFLDGLKYESYPTLISRKSFFNIILEKSEHKYEKINNIPNDIVNKYDETLMNNLLGDLENHVNKKNYFGVVKALCGMIYDCYDLSAQVGTDMDEAFTLVHDNNMSKLCNNETDAITSVKHYVAQYDLLQSNLTDEDGQMTIQEYVTNNNITTLLLKENEKNKSVFEYIQLLNKYDSPNYRLGPDGKHYVVFNESTKKILKSCLWDPVDLTILYKW